MKWNSVLLFVVWSLECNGREPIIPKDGSLPFVVYFPSRYRGICVGTLISRTAVITAAVCVTNPVNHNQDTRPINVVVGATYRHLRRGVRVQVTKILIPNLANYTGQRGYLMEKSAAVLLLKRKVPDVLTEIPPRAVEVDFRGEEVLTLQEECFLPGWHFFYRGDKIYPVHKFLLQRNMRLQFINIVKKNVWCEALAIKFVNALSNLGFHGILDVGANICVRDGMYGAPMICRGKAVGMLMAPDAQWTNCTGFSNIIHLFSGKWLRGFMTCISSLFDVEIPTDWTAMKKMIYDDIFDGGYDYIPELYDKVAGGSSSSSAEV